MLPILLLTAAAATGQVWKAGPVLFQPGPAGAFDETAVKDPSIVFYAGRWHLFYTARGHDRYNIGYASAPTLETLNQATRHELTQLRGRKEEYAAAPQVFYFRPHKLWYLIYQTTDGWYLPVYSTTPTLDRPQTWSPPRPLVEHARESKWIDFWVICDAKNAYLYFTRGHKEVVVMKTRINEFPNGFREPKAVFGPLIEAAHIYRLQAEPEQYEMLFELPDGPLRKYGRATAPSAEGPWKAESTGYAQGRQLRFETNARPWTNEVSHGERLRTGYDERLVVDPKRVEFLIQGMPAAEHKGEYTSLPWRLGLIHRAAPKPVFATQSAP